MRLSLPSKDGETDFGFTGSDARPIRESTDGDLWSDEDEWGSQTCFWSVKKKFDVVPMTRELHREGMEKQIT